ncbi:hypothetical protein [Budvicia aquatica]|uniref:Lipoprotein n=1 Tax=Budvicia aquatica TaxID=82979 RepID=A0A484ZXB1_9GAMM|nr:hypothetical protein [Budvicia aquatica]VFS53064.1 Uncharacterised protein [Budvicia aquatica]
MKLLAKLILLAVFMVFLSSCDKSDQIKAAFQKPISKNRPEILIEKLNIEESVKNNIGVIYTATGIMRFTQNTYISLATWDDIEIIEESYHQGDEIPFSTRFSIFNLTPTDATIHSFSIRKPKYLHPLPFHDGGQTLEKFTNKTYIFNPKGDNSELIAFINDLEKQQDSNAQEIVKLNLKNKEIDNEIEKIRQEGFILPVEQKGQIQQINDKIEEIRNKLNACYKEKDSVNTLSSDPEIMSAYKNVSEKCDELSHDLRMKDYEKDTKIAEIIKPEEDEFINSKNKK